MKQEKFSRRDFLKVAGVSFGSLWLAACGKLPPTNEAKEIPQVIDLYSSLINSGGINYFISQRNVKEKDEHGLDMIHREDDISHIYSWVNGSEPQLLDNLRALTSNLAPNPDGGITFATQNATQREIITLPLKSPGLISIYKLSADIKSMDAIAISANGQVAFRADDESLYLLEDGHERRLTPEGERIFGQPVWSPDGKQIAYVHYKEDGFNPTWHIKTINADGTNSRQLGSFNSEQPAWGLDGELAWIQEGDVYSNAGENLSPRKLNEANQLNARNPAWSPDGRYIAFIANKGTPNPLANGGGMAVGQSALFITQSPKYSWGGTVEGPETDGISEFVWITDNIISYIVNQVNGSIVKTLQLG